MSRLMWVRRTLCAFSIQWILSLLVVQAFAQTASPWFDLPLPGPVTENTVDFDNLDLPPIPAPSVTEYPEMAGDLLVSYIEDIVGFAYASRDAGEKLWGRYAGSPHTDRAIDYVAGHLRDAGLVVQKQIIPFERNNHPIDWSLNLVGSSAFGEGSENVELRSALPMAVSGGGGTGIPGGPNNPPPVLTGEQTVTASVIFVGDGSATTLTNLDVKGKIAVYRMPPTPSAFYTDNRSVQTLVDAGAVGVLAIYDMPGNMQLYLSGCPAPAICFNLGGEDGNFLRAVIEKAAASGVLEQLELELSVTYAPPENLEARALIAKIEGRNSDENIVISTHSDSHFAGANDNASGMAALIALAKYYARAPQPEHDIYFFLSPGHHDATGGTRGLIDYDPELPKNNIVLLNLEHIGQAGTYRSYMSRSPDKYGYRQSKYVPTNWDSQGREVTLFPLDSKALRKAWGDAAIAYQFTAPGLYLGPAIAEPSAWMAADGPAIQDVETSPWFHTTGDTPEAISAHTMQRATLFYLDFVKRMDKLSRAEVMAK